MKYFYLILVFVTWGCMAQLPIKSLLDDFDSNDTYYKDTFNDFDKFVGTWKYESGATSITITLVKKLQQEVFKNNGDHYYLDYIVGGYKYIENGVEKINTLPLLVQNSNVYSYGINGYIIAASNSYYCLDCRADDRVLILGYREPNSVVYIMETEMLFKRVDSNDAQKLELNFRTISAPPEDVDAPAPQFSTYTVPFGKYVLTKVN